MADNYNTKRKGAELPIDYNKLPPEEYLGKFAYQVQVLLLTLTDVNTKQKDRFGVTTYLKDVITLMLENRPEDPIDFVAD